MPDNWIVGHDEWVRPGMGILVVSFLCRSIRWNMDFEILVNLAFTGRNRFVQSGEIAQLVSCVVGWEAEVVIHIDRIGIPRSRLIAFSCHPRALPATPIYKVTARTAYRPDPLQNARIEMLRHLLDRFKPVLFITSTDSKAS
jgi:hypothetical protein